MKKKQEAASQIIEEGKWLGESAIWKELGEFYQHKGKDAWNNSVPYQATSNPRIASSYAEMILAFLEDWLHQHGPFSAPCTIVEMGAGHGSFSLKMLRAIEERSEDFRELGIRLQYILTDLAASNVEAWKKDPSLLPYFESGIAKAEVFDCLSEEELLIDGAPFYPDDAPVVFIANYLFDSLPHEAFLFEKNEILRAKASISRRTAAFENDPDQWNLALDFHPFSREALSVPVSGLLDEYRKIGQQGCLLIPEGAIRCIGNLRNLSDDKMLLLCSDKALSTQNSISNRKADEIASFVSVSMIVNFHALLLYFQHEGGIGMTQKTQQEFLASAAFVMGNTSSRMRRTQRTFSSQLDQLSPGDLYSLASLLLAQRFNLSLGQMISLLKLVEWDAAVFDGLYDAIHNRLRQANQNEMADLLNALPHIAERRYPLPGSSDTLFCIAHLMQSLQRFPSAIELYQARLEERGEHPDILYNLGLCHLAIGEKEKAKAAFEHALALNPEMLPAQGFLYRIMQERPATAPALV